jgi:acetyl-CoA decarbonylase/synthase complex subunit delta
VLVAAAEEAAGERVALGNCEEKNYRTVVAAALANNQVVIAKTPIDVNLAKQLNVLISDMRLDRDRIIIDPTTGALGYGLEYTYSVMERVRLAALGGDSALQQPMIVTAGTKRGGPRRHGRTRACLHSGGIGPRGPSSGKRIQR